MNRSFSKCLSTAALLLATLSFGVPAQEREPERGGGRTLVDDKGIVRQLPQSMPDLAAFKAAMEPGTATIRGTAINLVDQKRGAIMMSKLFKLGNDKPFNQQSIYLVPYNSYTEEWVQLAMKTLNLYKKVYIAMDPAVRALEREVITNSSGDFSFRNVRPGRYLVFSFPEWHYNLVTGRQATTHRERHDRIDFHYEIVEVGEQDEVVEVNLPLKRILWDQ